MDSPAPAVRHRLHELTREIGQAYERSPRTVALATGVFTAAALAPLALGVWLLIIVFMDLPSKDAVSRIGDMDQATQVYDSSDQAAFTIFRQQRVEVPLSQISPNLVRALIATEDQRFYDHRGFDIYRIASAVAADIRHRRAAQGASTITQQLARQSFLKPQKTIRRKLGEIFLAGRIEQAFSKEKILELYLNKVYFGDGRYGAEAASLGYFGKHASELTVGEAAMLAGLVKAPSNYAPTVNLERATARRNSVLQSMLDAKVIDRAAWQAARDSRISLASARPVQEPNGQYFKEAVRRELLDRFGWDAVYQGGLRVFTTVDMEMQRAAEAVVAESLKSLSDRRQALVAKRRLPGVDQPLQAALVALDPRTGYVRVMIGGRDFNESHYNRALQAKRQPGSAFKPFVYAAAIESGLSPASLIDRLDEPIATLQGAWIPEDGHSSGSSMTLRAGLRTSSNRAAVRLLQRVGISRTVQYARTMGVGDMPAVPSLALGSGEVTLQSMTAAFAAFANRGLVPKPILIRRVEDSDGRVLHQEAPSGLRAINETTAFLMTTMLADVVNAGTAANARRLGFTLPAAGKTGTTNDYHDAWFVGYTPALVSGVWVGFDQPETILPRGFASDVAVPIWAKFMKSATAGDKPDWFQPPPGISTAKVCRISGKLASENCEHVEAVDKDGNTTTRSMVYTEYFDMGTQPTTYCESHETDGLFGKIAGLFGAGSEKPAPPSLESLIPEQAVRPVGSTGQVQADTTAERNIPDTTAERNIPDTSAQPRARRGFWSRVFGRDDEQGKQERQEQQEQQEQEAAQPTTTITRPNR